MIETSSHNNLYKKAGSTIGACLFSLLSAHIIKILRRNNKKKNIFLAHCKNICNFASEYYPIKAMYTESLTEKARINE